MKAEQIADIVKTNLHEKIQSLMKSNHLDKSWFEKHSEYSPKHILHSRILGLLTRIDFGNNWITDIERSLKPAKKGKIFTPDVIVRTPEDRIGAIIEYESINSSDSRIIWKDLVNYTNYVKYPSKLDGLPIIWIIITTLRHGLVEDWSFWDWTKREGFDQNKNMDDKDKLKKSPFNYYKERFIKKFEEAFEKTNKKCPVCWMNIDGGDVNIIKYFPPL